jgi:hypothetical protein
LTVNKQSGDTRPANIQRLQALQTIERGIDFRRIELIACISELRVPRPPFRMEFPTPSWVAPTRNTDGDDSRVPHESAELRRYLYLICFRGTKVPLMPIVYAATERLSSCGGKLLQPADDGEQ